MSTFYIKCKNDDIVHYGVLGMKWGVRKDRNHATQNKKIDKKKLVRNILIGTAFTAAVAGVSYAVIKKRPQIEEAIAISRYIKGLEGDMGLLDPRDNNAINRLNVVLKAESIDKSNKLNNFFINNLAKFNLPKNYKYDRWIP